MGSGASSMPPSADLPEQLDRATAQQYADELCGGLRRRRGGRPRRARNLPQEAAEEAKARAAAATNAAEAEPPSEDPLYVRIACGGYGTNTGDLKKQVQDCIDQGGTKLVLAGRALELSAALLELPALERIENIETGKLIDAHREPFMAGGYPAVRDLLREELRMRREQYAALGAAEQRALVASIIDCCNERQKWRAGINLRSVLAGEISSLILESSLATGVPPTRDNQYGLWTLSNPWQRPPQSVTYASLDAIRRYYAELEAHGASTSRKMQCPSSPR
mmetsp:Transcript_19903/g.53636  ORF Transcript_19903/g.53636 Transcript_19903/m.53636 type:complete len:279 (-) Transcript_19903:767-1603(-)